MTSFLQSAAELFRLPSRSGTHSWTVSSE